MKGKYCLDITFNVNMSLPFESACHRLEVVLSSVLQLPVSSTVVLSLLLNCRSSEVIEKLSSILETPALFCPY